jgi:hypothetical protein
LAVIILALAWFRLLIFLYVDDQASSFSMNMWSSYYALDLALMYIL